MAVSVAILLGLDAAELALLLLLLLAAVAGAVDAVPLASSPTDILMFASTGCDCCCCCRCSASVTLMLKAGGEFRKLDASASSLPVLTCEEENSSNGSGALVPM